MYKVGI